MIQKLLIFVLSASVLLLGEVVGIVPKRQTPIEAYERPAAGLNNIGELFLQGSQKTSCTATFVGQEGGVGVLLTAGHCVDVEDQKVLAKCSNIKLSFAPKNPTQEEEMFTVIGRYALSEYIDRSPDYEFDIGVVFIDMTNASERIAEHPIKLTPVETLGALGVVQVVGYGRTGMLDSSEISIRRIMSTHARLEEKNNHTLIAMDETPIENQKLEIPIGDAAAEGDSGGPILDAETKEILGVVSHRNGEKFYSEPLFYHADWVHLQIKAARDMFVFTPHDEGRLSSASTWVQKKRPLRFRNAYGEVNPLILVRSGQRVFLDDDLDIFGVSFKEKGGDLMAEGGERFVEHVNIAAPARVGSIGNGSLAVDVLDLAHKEVEMEGQLRVLSTLNCLSGVTLEKSLRLIQSGVINVKADLSLSELVFDERQVSAESSNVQLGELNLAGGVLTSRAPILHRSHKINVKEASRLKADYTLGARGELSFKLGASQNMGTPLLTIDGSAHFNGGLVKLVGSEALPENFEITLLKTKSLTHGAWKGVYDARMTDSDHELAFFIEGDALKAKVIPTESVPFVEKEGGQDLYKVF